MENIYENLYQFTTYIPPMDFTIHQYLLASDPAILFAAGGIKEAQANLPKIKKILNGRPIKYIFVSHMESDECGGLPVFLKEYPGVTVLGSALAARDLPGYGYTGNITVGSEHELLEDGELSLRFFDYPAEVHLQNGLVCYEQNSGIFYSADLMLSYGNSTGKLKKNSWENAVAAIEARSIPDAEKLADMKKRLLGISPELIAVGHGFCISCAE